MFSYAEKKQYWLLSNCNRILIFRSEFPDIPRKISAYLRTNSSSGANTQKIRGLYKILNINNLYLKGILSLCNMHHFSMWNGPFQMAKCTISHSNMGFFGTRNGQYQKTECIFSDYVIGYIKVWFGLKQALFHRF